jgi:hypothetical protein
VDRLCCACPFALASARGSVIGSAVIGSSALSFRVGIATTSSHYLTLRDYRRTAADMLRRPPMLRFSLTTRGRSAGNLTAAANRLFEKLGLDAMLAGGHTCHWSPQPHVYQHVSVIIPVGVTPTGLESRGCGTNRNPYLAVGQRTSSPRVRRGWSSHVTEVDKHITGLDTLRQFVNG